MGGLDGVLGGLAVDEVGGVAGVAIDIIFEEVVHHLEGETNLNY